MVRITTTIAPPAAEAQAREVIRSAYEVARRLREDAQVEAARAIEQARAEALAQVRAMEEERIARLERVIEDLAAYAPAALVRKAAPVVIDLAVEIARRIVQREVSVDPELLVQWVEDAASRLAGSSELTVRIHPDDLERLAPYRQRLHRGGVQINWVADPTVAGGCVVESAYGAVDARLDTQLAALHETLRPFVDA